MSTCCEAAIGHPFHPPYHNEGYGFPIADDNRLFERLVLEINQAGLSWLTILTKKDNFCRAYDGFDIATVARYSERDRERLLADAGIIRNRLKIDAAIRNAQQILVVQERHGSLRCAARSTFPANAKRMDEAVQEDVSFYGRRDRECVSHEYRLPPRRPSRRVPGVSPNRETKPTLDAERVSLFGTARMRL